MPAPDPAVPVPWGDEAVRSFADRAHPESTVASGILAREVLALRQKGRALLRFVNDGEVASWMAADMAEALRAFAALLPAPSPAPH